jgi:hypothetical protein
MDDLEYISVLGEIHGKLELINKLKAQLDKEKAKIEAKYERIKRDHSTHQG